MATVHRPTTSSFVKQFLELVRNRIEISDDLTVTSVAGEAEITRAYLHRVLYGDKNGKFQTPSLAVADRIAKAVGLELMFADVE